jgi:hydrogenase maturation protease
MTLPGIALTAQFGRFESGADPVRVLVLGYGNPGRQDDGLGPAAAAEIEALNWSNVTAYDNYQLTIEDAIDVAEHDVVWFVDASRVCAPPFAVTELSRATSVEFTSHLVRPEAILALAEQYYSRTPRAFLLAIRGYEFEFIEALTPRATDNLRLAVDALVHQIRTVQSEVSR